jgi:hypothetical protein
LTAISRAKHRLGSSDPGTPLLFRLPWRATYGPIYICLVRRLVISQWLR